MELWSRSACCFNGSGEPLTGDRGSIDGPGLGVAGPSLRLSAGVGFGGRGYITYAVSLAFERHRGNKNCKN